MHKSSMQQLIDGELPKMVRWYDPRLLARVGVRTLISAVFGQYADQRLIQAATDPAVGRDLVERYDYCSPAGDDPAKCVSVDDSGAFWIDYICDIGDGFEATYPMAYLLAQDRLELRGAGALPHGDILIMGGDQCYPQATRPEYRKRLQDPYAFALSGNEPKRKLFAIPGNHDWYDGLQAFDSLFCSSRDRLSESRGNLIGGWQCQQHRSYWALKLPHKWWIWGTDIQFSKYLDIAQINYFMAVAAEMGPDDKLIICMAEPSWMLADFQGQDEEENFFKITAIARMRGAKVCAVLAGDWHHYNRYSSAELGVHFFTAGGGGAFLHPTHVLKNEISVRWPEIRTTTYDNDEHGIVKHEMAAQRYDVRLKRPRKAGSKIEEAVRDVVEPIREIKEEIKEEIKAKVKQKKAEAPLRPRAPKCYPKRSTSLLLSLRNMAFPLFNFPFAIGIGIIYWLITWQFHTVVRAYDISAGKIDQVGLTVAPQTVLAWMPLYMLQATLSMSFAVMLMGLYAALVWYVDAEEKPGLRRILVQGRRRHRALPGAHDGDVRAVRHISCAQQQHCAAVRAARRHGPCRRGDRARSGRLDHEGIARAAVAGAPAAARAGRRRTARCDAADAAVGPAIESGQDDRAADRARGGGAALSARDVGARRHPRRLHLGLLLGHRRSVRAYARRGCVRRASDQELSQLPAHEVRAGPGNDLSGRPRSGAAPDRMDRDERHRLCRWRAIGAGAAPAAAAASDRGADRHPARPGQGLGAFDRRRVRYCADADAIAGVLVHADAAAETSAGASLGAKRARQPARAFQVAK